MTTRWKPHLGALTVGLASLASGGSILTQGLVWNLNLGEAKHVIGGLLVVFGVYCLFLALKVRR